MNQVCLSLKMSICSRTFARTGTLRSMNQPTAAKTTIRGMYQ